MEDVEGFEIRRPYQRPLRVAHDFAANEANGPGALQSFKDECDINRIMAGYQRTGVATWLEQREGQYKDVTGLDFLLAMDTVVKAREMFDELPSSVRDKFYNDPALFLDFMHDPKNQDEMIALGLARRKPEPEVAKPIEVIVVEKKD